MSDVIIAVAGLCKRPPAQTCTPSHLTLIQEGQLRVFGTCVL